MGRESSAITAPIPERTVFKVVLGRSNRSSVSREWFFSPVIDPDTGELSLGGSEDTHTIFVSIGEDGNNVRAGEMIVSV